MRNDLNLKKVVLKNFAIFTGNWKASVLEFLFNFIKKSVTNTGVFQ